MKKLFYLISILSFILIQSCLPTIEIQSSGQIPITLNDKTTIYFFKPSEQIPNNSKFIGNINIRDSGFSLNCSCKKVLKIVEEQAKLNGANIIHISRVKKPSIASTCCEITAKLYRNLEKLALEHFQGKDSINLYDIEKEILIIDTCDNLFPDTSFIKSICIKNKFWSHTNEYLISKAVDSTILASGNCLKIKYLKDEKSKVQYNVNSFEGDIYMLTDSTKNIIRKIVTKNKYTRDSLVINRRTSKDFELTVGMQYSMFTLDKNLDIAWETKMTLRAILVFSYILLM